MRDERDRRVREETRKSHTLKNHIERRGIETERNRETERDFKKEN